MKPNLTGHVVWWLTTCPRKPKVPVPSPAASYVQRWALSSNRPANVLVSVKRVEVVVRNYINTLPLPLQSCDSWMVVKGNPDRKKNLIGIMETWYIFCDQLEKSLSEKKKFVEQEKLCWNCLAKNHILKSC